MLHTYYSLFLYYSVCIPTVVLHNDLHIILRFWHDNCKWVAVPKICQQLIKPKRE